MDSPLMFSFVTAIKDGFGDLRLTIPTVLGQTLPNFEWIIVDDASASPLAGEFPALAADPRVKILRNEQGLGQTASLNRGIDEAKGEWIVRMDGDDLCAPDRLARVEEELKAHPSTELLFSDYAVIDAANRAWAQMRMRHPLSPAFFSYLESQNNPICHPTTVFRRRKPGGAIRHFRTDLVNAQDYALWREILAESGPGSFLHLAHPSVSYRIVRDSLSGARAPEQAVEKNAIRSNQT
ncbi:MAG: glycosyltransferase, partial [Bdellovibrionota bacterium]